MLQESTKPSYCFSNPESLLAIAISSVCNHILYIYIYTFFQRIQLQAVQLSDYVRAMRVHNNQQFVPEVTIRHHRRRYVLGTDEVFCFWHKYISVSSFLWIGHLTFQSVTAWIDYNAIHVCRFLLMIFNYKLWSGIHSSYRSSYRF